MKVKDLKIALNGMNDEDEIVFELDYSDGNMKKLALSLAFESLYGDECEPLYMDVSKITNYVYEETFHPVISLNYSDASHTTLLDSDAVSKMTKAIESIDF